MSYLDLVNALSTYVLVTVVIGAGFALGAWWAGRD